MLVPLGAACRVTYQLRNFSLSAGIPVSSYPIDWCITSSKSLKIILEDTFDPHMILAPENFIEFIGSIKDSYSDIIFYHNFHPNVVKYIGFKNFKAQNEDARQLILQAKERFIHCYSNLISLRNYHSHIFFVRWLRRGIPDKQIPTLFAGHDTLEIFDLIGKFLRHDNFSLLCVSTWTVPDLDFKDSIVKFDVIHSNGKQKVVNAVLKERKGFNGDLSNSYKGDSLCWFELLNRFIQLDR